MRKKDFIMPLYYLLMDMICAFLNIFIRRDKSIVLLGAWYGRRFGGNSRYLYQYLSETKEKYGLKKVIWVTRSSDMLQELRNAGYEVYLMHSWQSYYYHLKAGIHCASTNTASSSATNKTVQGDILGMLSMGAVRIYLNHGISSIKGNKFLEYANLSRKDKFVVCLYKWLHSVTFFRHFMLVPGGWDKAIYISLAKENTSRDKARHLETERLIYIETGFPELCKCLKFMPREERIVNEVKAHDKRIVYLPTYRTSDATGYRHPLDNEHFCCYLRNNGYYWIDKLHPGAKDKMNAKNYDRDISIKLDAEFDINLLMRDVDVLVTDYSTVSQKAIYFDVPVIYYLPDHEGYLKEDKSVIGQFADDLAGDVAYNEKELQNKLDECFKDDYMHKWEKRHMEIKERFFDNRISDYENIVQSLLECIREKW